MSQDTEVVSGAGAIWVAVSLHRRLLAAKGLS